MGSESNFDEDLYKKKRYVPVALVLETETEYHDAFRQILLALFDLIRVPPEIYHIPVKVPVSSAASASTPALHNEKIVESRNIAFADLVAHIAFLKTIPAPPFNSVYHIHMLPII
jgi:hypothetical protein